MSFLAQLQIITELITQKQDGTKLKWPVKPRLVAHGEVDSKDIRYISSRTGVKMIGKANHGRVLFCGDNLFNLHGLLNDLQSGIFYNAFRLTVQTAYQSAYQATTTCRRNGEGNCVLSCARKIFIKNKKRKSFYKESSAIMIQFADCFLIHRFFSFWWANKKSKSFWQSV